jgi:hypothetical protein
VEYHGGTQLIGYSSICQAVVRSLRARLLKHSRILGSNTAWLFSWIFE